MAEFTIPNFLNDYTTDDVYEAMQAILPQDIDSSEGSHVWNLTRPTALVIAELCEFVLPQVIQLIFPEWSYGEFLDAHAKSRGMTRKAATAATGNITLTGSENTVIPAGTTVSTASLNNEDPAVAYQTTEDATIPISGTVTIPIVCTEAGTIGNTNPNTIILLGSTVVGIASVTNQEAVSGGTDEESDEDLIVRIEEYDQTQGDSYIGNISDYKRWAMSVSGVGNAAIIPANDSSGLVTIVLTDATGNPASSQLCTEVYDYIMSPDDPTQRVAPINAYLSVIAPETIEIGIKATVELTEESTIDAVQGAFIENMIQYLPEALSDGEIKITKVAAILSGTTGVNDFADLQIGIDTDGTITYGTTNIQIESTQLPTITNEDVTLTEGTV